MLSIYKPDQGYWTRLLSALGFGALVAWGAMYVFEQLGTVDVPEIGHRLVLDPPIAELGPGDSVELFMDGVDGSVGTASIVTVEDEGAAVMADSFIFGDLGDGPSPSVFNIATLAPAGQGVFAGSEIAERRSIDAYPQIYLQCGVAIGVSVLGALVLLYLCYANRKTVEFLIATEGEMKKVNWSSRREVLGSTWVVIAISLIIAVILLIADIAFSSFFRSIDLLES